MPTPRPSPSSTTSAEPFEFASEGAATAAAAALYSKFISVSDRIANDGGKNPGRIRTVAKSFAVAQEIEGFKQFRQADAHSEGLTEYDSLEVQAFGSNDEGAYIVFNVCDDISGVDVVDEDGFSLVSTGRPARAPFIVRISGTSLTSLQVQQKVLWDGRDFCAPK